MIQQFVYHKLNPILFQVQQRLSCVEYCQTPDLAKSKSLGVGFVFPLSQWLSQGSQPHPNIVVPGKLEVWNFVWKLIKA